MIYKVRVIADIREDVFRDIEIKKNESLEHFHLCIIEAFNLPKGNMASFIKCNEEWEQLEEIPLENLQDETDQQDDSRPLPFSKKCMRDIKISDMLVKRADRLIYLSDFINMYSFHIELLEEKQEEKEVVYPIVVLEYGDASIIFSRGKGNGKNRIFENDDFEQEELEDKDWNDEDDNNYFEEYDEEYEEEDEKY